MSRKKDVFEKLDYADERFGDLGDKVFEAGMKGVKVKFLSNIVSDILSCSREVFDFCALDIAEIYIAPNDSDVAAGLSSGTTRCYYPFYKTQLTKRNALFSKLKTINRPLHNHLFSIAAAVEKNAERPNTLFNYGDLTELADMVNQKKHDKLLKVEPSGADTIFASNDHMKIMIPTDEQVGISYVKMSPDATISRGDRYVFEHNKKDIMNFSMRCKNLSRILMEELYTQFLY